MFRSSPVLLLFFTIQCTQPEPLAKIQDNIVHEFTHGKGTFALAWKDIQTGEQILINADSFFHAASTMKTPVMIEVYKQADDGRFALSDSVTIQNQFYSIVDSSLYSLSNQDDSEPELYNQIGKKKSIADLVYQMIISSSNLATNIIIDLVDARKVTESMQALGAKNIEVLRGVEDTKAFESGLNNRTTANDLLAIFDALAKGIVVSAEANNEMLEILFDQKFNDIIPALLPSDVKIAHKTGSITGVHHDSGIVFLPDGRKYVLIILSKNLQDFDLGTSTMARVSKIIYDYMMRS
jgi:beta-lactamase class A